MTIQIARQRIFEEKKKYQLIGLDRLIFLFSYKDYNSILSEVIQMEYNDPQSPIRRIGESKISWSPMVEDGAILTAID